MSRFSPDPSAVLGIAMSLYEAGATGNHGCVSEACNGADQFMRECMHVAECFEKWACETVDFDSLADVWPYTLHDKFGEAFFKRYSLHDMSSFGYDSCGPLAASLGLPTVNLDIYYKICKLGRLVNHAEKHWGWTLTEPGQLRQDHPTEEAQLKYLRERLDSLGGPQWTVGWFGLDDGPAFQGFSNGETWNGWEKPHFSRAVADQLVAWLNSVNNPGETLSYYDKGLQAYVIKAQDDQEDEVVTASTDPKLPGGFYGIGAGSWIWDRFSDLELGERKCYDGTPE